MKIRVHASGPGRDRVLRKSIGRCFREAMDGFAARIRRVLVYVVEMNNPHDGETLYCRAVVELYPHGTLVADDRDRTAQAAVTQTAARLAAAVARRLRHGKAQGRGTGGKRMVARRPGHFVRVGR